MIVSFGMKLVNFRIDVAAEYELTAALTQNHGDWHL